MKWKRFIEAVKMSDSQKNRVERYIVSSRLPGSLSSSAPASVSTTYVVEASDGNRIHVTDRASLRRAVATVMKDRKAVD